jgi:hypothetical protein
MIDESITTTREWRIYVYNDCVTVELGDNHKVTEDLSVPYYMLASKDKNLYIPRPHTYYRFIRIDSIDVNGGRNLHKRIQKAMDKLVKSVLTEEQKDEQRGLKLKTTVAAIKEMSFNTHGYKVNEIE